MSLSEDLLFDSKVITYKVLIVCLGNTNYEIFSAGIESKNEKISDLTIKVLNDNIPIVKERSNNIKEYKDIYFDKIIVLDKNIKAKDLINSKIISYNFYEDPYNCSYDKYQETLINIEKRIKEIYGQKDYK